MVTILRGFNEPNKPNAIADICNALINHLKIEYRIEYINKSIYRVWLSKYNDDIVHSLFIMYTPVFKSKQKIVTTIYDMVPLRYPEAITSIVRLQYKIAYRNLRRADKIVTISEFQKREIIRLLGINEDKIRIIYLGIDHNLFNDRTKREDAIEKLGLSANYRYACCVSNTAMTKNLQLLNKIEKVLPDDVRILTTGYRKWDGRKIVSLGYLKEEELPLIYRASSVFIHPSIYEGFGLAVLEACACGIPIVAYGNTTQPEITRNGLVDTEEEFIGRTLKLIDNPQKNITGVEDASRFSWSKMAREYEELYEEMKE